MTIVMCHYFPGDKVWKVSYTSKTVDQYVANQKVWAKLDVELVWQREFETVPQAVAYKKATLDGLPRAVVPYITSDCVSKEPIPPVDAPEAKEDVVTAYLLSFRYNGETLLKCGYTTMDPSTKFQSIQPTILWKVSATESKAKDFSRFVSKLGPYVQVNVSNFSRAFQYSGDTSLKALKALWETAPCTL